MKPLLCIVTILFCACLPQFPIDPDPVPILCYHNINPIMHNEFNIHPKKFEEQVKYFKDSGYTSILTKDINTRPKRSVMFTFDDGKHSVYKYAFPILEKYGFKGIVFLIVNDIGNYLFMNKTEIESLIKNGWEIGSHTINHPNLCRISKDNLVHQLEDSKKILEEIFYVNIQSIAYPYGAVNQTVINECKNYYKYAFTIIKGNEIFVDKLVLKRYMILND